MSNYFTEQDIVKRLLCRFPTWTTPESYRVFGFPTISLTGQENHFGQLVFTFNNGPTIEYTVFLKNMTKMMKICRNVISNFTEIAAKLRE